MSQQKTAIDAIAHVLWDNYDDVKDGRYRPGRTSIPVYTVGEREYCAPSAKQKPATDRDDFDGNSFHWEPVGEAFGRTVYRSRSEAEVEAKAAFLRGELK